MRYVVTRFGVDLQYNEYQKPIWDGEACSKEDAIQKAVDFHYKEEDREFMKGYLQAHIPCLN